MKCEVHGTEMEYAGEDPFGGDIWFCQMCNDEEDYYVWHNDAYQQDHPDEFPELREDEPPENPCHNWEPIWDDGVGQICQVCAICGEERVIHYDYEPEENGR